MKVHIDQILNEASKLPPFPRAAQKALTLLEDPDVSAARLVEVLELDPTLTARVLRQANSAAAARAQRTDNVKQALAFLGNGRFRELVFASASVSYLAGSSGGYQLEAGELWRHSVATGVMAQILSEQLHHKASPALYTAALLHDIGKSVLGLFVRDQAKAIAAEVERGKSFLEAERAVLDMDHASLGALIAERWNFSPDMVELIRFHHQPEAKPDKLEVSVLALANVLCQFYGATGGIDGLEQKADPELLKRLGFKQKDLEAALAELHPRMQKAEALLSLAPTPHAQG